MQAAAVLLGSAYFRLPACSGIATRTLVHGEVIVGSVAFLQGEKRQASE